MAVSYYKLQERREDAADMARIVDYLNRLGGYPGYDRFSYWIEAGLARVEWSRDGQTWEPCFPLVARHPSNKGGWVKLRDAVNRLEQLAEVFGYCEQGTQDSNAQTPDAPESPMMGTAGPLIEPPQAGTVPEPPGEEYITL